MAVISMKQLLKQVCISDTRPEDGTLRWLLISFGEKWYLYHRPSEDRKENRRSDDFMRSVAETGKPILLGTKKQAQQAIRDEAARCGQYFVSERWLGGMLTNHKTIAQRIKRLSDLHTMEEDGTFDKLKKRSR